MALLSGGGWPSRLARASALRSYRRCLRALRWIVGARAALRSGRSAPRRRAPLTDRPAGDSCGRRPSPGVVCPTRLTLSGSRVAPGAPVGRRQTTVGGCWPAARPAVCCRGVCSSLTADWDFQRQCLSVLIGCSSLVTYNFVLLARFFRASGIIMNYWQFVKFSDWLCCHLGIVLHLMF